jgi:hypothetical protein
MLLIVLPSDAATEASPIPRWSHRPLPFSIFGFEIIRKGLSARFAIRKIEIEIPTPAIFPARRGGS